MSDVIGSRHSQTTVYKGLTKEGLRFQVVCGCFRGSLVEFEKKVKETHENNPKYLDEYLSFIEKVKIYFDIEEGE